jgi:hypothetical protein
MAIPNGFVEEDAPFGVELTIKQGAGDSGTHGKLMEALKAVQHLSKRN